MLNGAELRSIILKQSRRANVGHIGSALSIADLVVAIYGCMNVDDPDDPGRDRFVLSKGHASLAVYGALYLKGWLSEEELNGYCGDNSLLGVHPEHALRGIDFCTGSLGQGLSMGVGAALAARMKNESRRVFVLVSDAECDEGSMWEAAMFAAHHRLSNLFVVADLNGQQALGYTADILNLSPMAARWRAFGWDVQEIDGHNIQQLQQVVEQADITGGPPHVLIARTVFGKGVSYMESEIKWHYLPMTEADFQQALKEVAETAQERATL